MGDILPPKRQAVVDRLRRRIELYRRHQESVYPRYESASNGVYEQTRQDTLSMKQRFLEAKAKKAKKSDHKNANKDAQAAANNGSNLEAAAQRSLLVQKLNKRSAPVGSPSSLDGHLGDDPDRQQQQAKILRTSGGTPDASNNPGGIGGNNPGNGGNNAGGTGQRSGDQKFQSQNQQNQSQQNNQQLQSISVQIVQQFTSSASPQSQHSQTIQTNVTVKALPGGNIKPSNSPKFSTTGSGMSSGGGGGGGPGSNNPSNNDDLSGTSISVGTNFECKRERETELGGCGNPLAGTGSCNNTNTTASSGQNHGTTDSGIPNSNINNGPTSAHDRFAETLANLGFPDDSNDDVIHPDILNDLFADDDDLFTNPTDLMKDFNFGEVAEEWIDMDKALAAATTQQSVQQQQHINFQYGGNSSQTTQSQNVNSVFDNNPTSGGNSAGSPGTAAFSPRLQNSFGNMNTGVMDFKLREPSPAAQTLKQMAEQHQNMQQKQMGLGGMSTNISTGMGPGLTSPHHHHHHHPNSPFGGENFGDPMSMTSLRTNFLNGSGTSLSPMSKGSPSTTTASSGMNFPQMSFAQTQQAQMVQQTQHSPQQNHSQQQSSQTGNSAAQGPFSAGIRPGAGVVFKQETNTGVYPGLANSGNVSCTNPNSAAMLAQRMSPLGTEMELHKRQSMQMQRITPDHKPHVDNQFGVTAKSNLNTAVHSPVDQKPNLSSGPQQGPSPSLGGQVTQPSSYVATRPLSHFSEPSGNQAGVTTGPQQQQQQQQHPSNVPPNRGSPVSSLGPMGGTPFMRNNVANSRITPPPQNNQQKAQGHFNPSPIPTRSPSGVNIQMSQSQQMQINQGNQQLQVNQSQQFQMNHDVKPQIHQQQSGPGPGGPNQQQTANMDGAVYTNYQASQHQSQTGNVGPNQFQMSMSQSQSVNFGTPFIGGGNSGNTSTPIASVMEPTGTTGRQRVHPNHRQQQQFMNTRPPPEYKAQSQNVQLNGMIAGMGKQPRYPMNVRMAMAPNYQESTGHVRGPHPHSQHTQNAVGALRSPQVMVESGSGNPYAQQGGQMTLGGAVGTVLSPNQTVNVSQSVQGKSNANSTITNKPIYTSALTRNRAPNVNVGPEGLNISQRPPVEWRQMFQQQEQAHQLHLQQSQQMTMRGTHGGQNNRFPSYSTPRGGMQHQSHQQTSNAYNQVSMGTGNMNSTMVNRGHPMNTQMQQQQQQMHMQQHQHMHHIQQNRSMVGGGGVRGQRPPHLMMAQQQQQHQMMMQQQHVIDNAEQSGVNANPQGGNMALQMAQSQVFVSSGMATGGINSRGAASTNVNNANSNNNVVSSNHNTLSGSDNGQFSLDFLDAIEPSTTDLLSFDQTHFSLLDEMGILGK